MNSRLYIAMYHYTRDLQHSRYPGIKGLDVGLFKKQIEFFKANFSVVTMEQVIAAVNGQTSLPRNAILLTFDDGYIDNYTYALPILEDAGVQGSFFISGKTFATHRLLDVNKVHYILASADISKLLPDVFEQMNYYRGKEFEYASNEELFAEYGVGNRFDSAETIFVKRMLQTVLPEPLRNGISSDLFKKYVGVSEETLAYELYLSEEQIRTMKRHGMYIGVHGFDHYWLGNLPEEKMKADISAALDVMDSFIDRNEWVMNYPYGSYNRSVIDYISSHGAACAVTTEVRVADLSKDSKFELPRLDCNDFPPKSEGYKKY